MKFDVVEARGPSDLDQIRSLRRTYVKWLGIPHIVNEMEAELARLPGSYAPPMGALFLASSPGREPVGCIGVRPFDRPGACEIKHLFVLDDARGSRIGPALVEAAVEAARSLGYDEALLDVLPWMKPAQAIYRKAGFEPIPPYWNNPEPDVLFFAKRLAAA